MHWQSNTMAQIHGSGLDDKYTVTVMARRGDTTKSVSTWTEGKKWRYHRNIPVPQNEMVACCAVSGTETPRTFNSTEDRRLNSHRNNLRSDATRRTVVKFGCTFTRQHRLTYGSIKALRYVTVHYIWSKGECLLHQFKRLRCSTMPKMQHRNHKLYKTGYDDYWRKSLEWILKVTGSLRIHEVHSCIPANWKERGCFSSAMLCNATTRNRRLKGFRSLAKSSSTDADSSIVGGERIQRTLIKVQLMWNRARNNQELKHHQVNDLPIVHWLLK